MLSKTISARGSLNPEGIAWAILVALCVLAGFGAIALGGTKSGLALALLVAFGPLAVYAGLRAPMVFPFGLFLVLVPFDNLLAFSSFGTLTKLLGLVSGVAFIFHFLLTRRYVNPDRAAYSWLPFLVVAVASFGWAIDPARGLDYLLSMVEFVGLYMIVAFLPMDRRTLGSVVAAITAGGAIAGAYGAYLFRSGVNVEWGRLFITVGGSAIDPNHFGAALILPLALALTALVEAKRLPVRMFAVVCAILIGAGIFVSGSRGAMLAAAITVTYMIVRSHKRLLLSGIVLGGACVGIAAFAKAVSRFNEIAATGGAGRLGIWRVAAVAFERRPFAGAGLGNFSIAYNDSFLSVPAFASMKIVEGAHWTIAPHNNLVWVGVELGTIGVIALLYAWWMQFRSMRLIVPRSDLYPLRVAVEAAIIGQFVEGLTIGTLTYKYLWVAFMLAMMVRNAAVLEGGKERESIVSPVLQTATRGR